MQICHLSSVHSRFDTRIFLKMCRSLSQAGYEVILVVADGEGDEVCERISIIDVGKSNGRLGRMWDATRRVLAAAHKLNADVYHLHDPELLPAGLALKRAGKRVIFDAHEDVPKDILSKPYLPTVTRHPISAAARLLENFACERLDHVVAATPTIRQKFEKNGIAAVDVNNFPILEELCAASISNTPKAHNICYIGGIAAARGIREMVLALPLCRSGPRLNLAGTFQSSRLRKDIVALRGWDQVTELGHLGRDDIRATLARSTAGLVTLHPTPAYLDSLPIKMFEYMSASLPVIASDFPLWREIVEGAGCGLLVDPQDPQAIADAMQWIIDHPEEAAEMGRRGRAAVEERYNWEAESEKLVALYRELLETA